MPAARPLRIGALLVALGGVGWGGLWLWTTERLRAGYDVFVAEAAAEGWQIASNAPVRSGWPVAAALALPSVVVTGGGAGIPGGLTWTADQVRLRIAAARPGTLEIVPSGGQTLRFGQGPALPAHADRLIVAVPLDGVGPAQVSVAGLAITTPPGRVAVGSASASVTDQEMTVDMHGIGLPDAFRHLMDADIGALAFHALLTRPFPPADTSMQRASLWRQAGGAVDVPDLAVQWGALSATGRLKVRLDARLQPDVDALLHVAGASEALDAAVRTGMVPPRSAMAAKAVLALLAAPAHGGPVDVPLQMRDGLLVVARFPLLRVPELDWTPR